MQGRQKLLVGLDEAGYGPNLGPLVVVAVCMKVPEQTSSEQLWEQLWPEVSNYPARSADQLVVDDSKRAYSGGGLETLERTALAWMALSRGVPETLHELWSLYSLSPLEDFEQSPWYAEEPLPLPCSINQQDLQAAQKTLLRCLKRIGCQGADVACQIVLPARFNRMLNRRGTKSDLLFDLSSQLIKAVERASDVTRIEAIADKQGGRHYYGDLLQHAYPQTLVMAGSEGRQLSHYVVTKPRRTIHLRFVSQADSRHLLVAAASMIAKYVRELCMRRFNAYWTALVPELRPTAGYPEDAARFAKQVEATARRLGIPRHMFWRVR